MRNRFGIEQTSWVPTGVDFKYFERPPSGACQRELVFVGSMDWMPNIDGMRWFIHEVLPLIRAQMPTCRLAIVGRNPPPSILAEDADPLIEITGTVPEVRPFLWESAVSIVPLRVGGGTRLKIFEAVAAGTPVVSTTIGAEGLPLVHPDTIRIGDSAQDFATECLALLGDERARNKMAVNALKRIRGEFSWKEVARRFEQTFLEARQIR